MPDHTDSHDGEPSAISILACLRAASLRATPARCLVINVLASSGPLPLAALVTTIQEGGGTQTKAEPDVEILIELDIAQS